MRGGKGKGETLTENHCVAEWQASHLNNVLLYGKPISGITSSWRKRSMCALTLKMLAVTVSLLQSTNHCLFFGQELLISLKHILRFCQLFFLYLRISDTNMDVLGLNYTQRYIESHLPTSCYLWLHQRACILKTSWVTLGWHSFQ